MLTSAQKIRLTANYEYWRKREEQQRELYLKEEEQQLREIERIYERMYADANEQIEAFYGKYASAEGIDITEAKRRVAQADVEAFAKKAEEYAKDRNFSKKANEEMRLYNATMKINRLELLKAQIGLYLVDGTNSLEQFYETTITDRTERELERQAGILGESITNANVVKRAKNIVNASFFNATYSDRIWSHQENLKSEINIELQRGLIAGNSSREMARRIRQKFDVSRSDAERLMVTELRRVQTDVARDSYKQNGIQQYIYMAVNRNACPICREIDGEVYSVDDMEPAKNAPPMHPRCHCTTAPYIDEAEYEAWLNWLESGGTTEGWKELSEAEKKEMIRLARELLDEEETPMPSTGFDRNNIQWSEDGKYLKDWCESGGVEYREVKELQNALEPKQIITRLAGGDMTRGSCVSLACAYTGNRAGLNVLDFRGGQSCYAFSLHSNNSRLAHLAGVSSVENSNYSSVKGAKMLMDQMETDKEYMLVTGRHASIVRKTDAGYEYLELQSGRENGWKSFEAYGTVTETLRKRFGCTSSRSLYGMKLEQHSYMIDIETLYNSDEFRDLLGYINTAESDQQKGASGSVK